MDQTAAKPGPLKREIDTFFTALTFLTRLPAPKSYQFQQDYLAAACKYYSAVGVVLGLIQLALLALFSLVLPAELALLLTLALGLLLTGGFHEDGLADMADGFGGGWQAEQVLTIMKDSRLGSYGALALISVLGLKFYSLSLFVSELGLWQLGLVLILGQSLSRAVATSLMAALPYLSQQDSKVAAMTSGLPSHGLTLLALFSLPFCLLLLAPLQILVLLALLAGFRQCFAAYLKYRIGGYTGDCLGAAQQISEVLIYLVCIQAMFA